MSEFLDHILAINKQIGGALHHIDPPLLGRKVYFYTDDIVGKAAYMDVMGSGQTSMGLIHCFVARARDANGKLIFETAEEKKLVFGDADKAGLRMFTHFCEAARMMIAYDNKLVKDSSPMKAAEGNSKAQPESGSTS